MCVLGLMRAADVGSRAMRVELLIFWGGAWVACELFTTLGSAVRRTMELEQQGFRCKRVVQQPLPLAAPAA